MQAARAEIRDAELVFVGYGIEAPEYRWDDYKGVDVRGKVLVMMNNDPDWSDDLFQGNRRLFYGRWVYKYEIAAKKGAAGVIIVHTTSSAGYPWQVVQTSWGGEEFSLPDRGEPRIQVKGWATEPATRKLLAAAGHDLDALVAAARSRDFRPVPLGIRTSIALANKVRQIETGNVLGLMPGSDAQLDGEVVVFTAHHDRSEYPSRIEVRVRKKLNSCCRARPIVSPHRKSKFARPFSFQLKQFTRFRGWVSI